MNLSKHNSQAGLTLVEVMVAAVILFSSIATVSLIYRGAILSSAKAEQHVSLAGVLPIILSNIKQEIASSAYQESMLQNKKGAVWDVQYQWHASLINKVSAPMKLDTDTGNYVTPAPRYNLWQVELDVSSGEINQHYSYKEFSWDDAQ